MIKVSAPGKVMLFGEHAVVYGHPCIVTAVSERLTVSIEKSKGRENEFNVPDGMDTRFIEASINVFRQCTKKEVLGCTISTQCPFSGKYGFGSSSAVTVATMFALSRYFGVEMNLKQVFDCSYKTVLSVQTCGSGFDVAAAVYGQTVEYVKGGSILRPIPFELGNETALIVGYSGTKANTKSIVNDIAKKREEYPEKVNRIFTAIGEIVGKVKIAITEKDWETVGKYMNFNQEYLRDLGVSTEKLEAMISKALKAGAYGSKLSGAGGGDCTISLVPLGVKKDVEEAIKNAGGEVVDVEINQEGVKDEKR